MPRIMCHHYNLHDNDRDFIIDKANRMKKFYDRVHAVSVILDSAKNQCVAEILIFGAHVNLRVEHSSPDMRTAFEAAINKAERMLRKHKEKRFGNRLHHRNNLTIRHLGDQDDPQEFTKKTNSRHAPQQLEAKPMSLGEARLQIETQDKELMFFLNSETEEINVLHRTGPNEVHLIEMAESNEMGHTVEVHS